eukprot:gene4388-6204_t
MQANGNTGASHSHEVFQLKKITKLLNRIQRILVPSNRIIHNPQVSEKFDNIQQLLSKGKLYDFVYDENYSKRNKANQLILRKINWQKFEAEVLKATNIHDELEFIMPVAIQEEINGEKVIHIEEDEKFIRKENIKRLQARNGLSVLPGKWRKTPYAPRKYERLEKYVTTNHISYSEGEELLQQLDTPLDGFLGQAYNYDDHGLTEEWMVSFKDGKSLASDDEVIRTQIVSLIDIMIVQVQDRVCTENGVLRRNPLQLGTVLKEMPVWGLDSYTRRMIEIAIEDRVASEKVDEETIAVYIKRKLLPAINAQLPHQAHMMPNALNSIIQDESSSQQFKDYSSAILSAIKEYGIDLFKIHPKGTGVVCIAKEGIAAHVMVTEYLGELYPPYRWCERLDVVEQAQKFYELKPTLPDFYNILLERPRQDPAGYGLLFVDASQRANLGSSCSHSCESNCTSSVVSRNGKLVIVLTTNRHIHCGEELTMDYYSITTSDVEWRAAICLCGMPACRGSFLHYATQDDLQQILNQNCGPLWRFSALLRNCSNRPLRPDDEDVLNRHGMGNAALGKNPPLWMKKYAVENLKLIEYERKALPCALMRAKDVNGSTSIYTFSSADMDARSVMEQRIQSLVCSFSMIQQILQQQTSKSSSFPLVAYTSNEAISKVYEKLYRIPDLLNQYLIDTDEEVDFDNLKKGSPGNTKKLKAIAVRKTAVQTVIQKILSLLEEDRPKGLNTLRELLLKIRLILIEIECYSVKKARINQLNDILVLWAYTQNFCYAQEYDSIESGPITVPARDLGTNILRNKIFKFEIEGLRPRPEHKSESNNSNNNINNNNNSMAEEMELSYWPNVTSESQSLPVHDNQTEKTEECIGNNHNNNNDLVINIINEVQNPADISMFSCETDKETASDLTRLENSLTCDDNIPINGYDVDTSQLKQSSLSTAESNDDHIVDVIDNHNISDSTTTSSSHRDDNRDETAAVTADDHQSLLNNQEFAAYLSPDEPIYTSTKKYPSLFTFWQLMGWYNAGTDEKVDAPNLFGCVQLPEPSCCFGYVEQSYGAKQRQILIDLLREDKMQTMPWPKSLKACFNSPSTSSTFIMPSVLYGSPMLDSSLGKVGAVERVVQELLATESFVNCLNQNNNRNNKTNGNDSSHKSKSNGESVINSPGIQFDNILPPELPTSWVQCDLCHKWRRIPYHIDPESLVDTWNCTMNTWDGESANCNAPQDDYDPIKENTVDVAIANNGNKDGSKRDSHLRVFQVNESYDLWCNRNKLYYEAVVKQIKKPKRTNNDEFKPTKVLFHFIGWSSSFDEWIPSDSDRIAPHNLYTNPLTKDPREQEKWQGRLEVAKEILMSVKVTKSTKSNKKKTNNKTNNKKKINNNSKTNQQNNNNSVNNNNNSSIAVNNNNDIVEEEDELMEENMDIFEEL